MAMFCAIILSFKGAKFLVFEINRSNLRIIWVDNIRMDLQEEGCWYVDWIGLAQDRDR